MSAIPMLGSLGSIVARRDHGRLGTRRSGRSLLAAGMFLFATLGFVVVQLDRQRKQRTQAVTGTRTEYLRYLGTVREIAREAAAAAASRPALAAPRRRPHCRPWPRSGPGCGSAPTPTPEFLQVRYGVVRPAALVELVPPEPAPIEQVDPVAASALHRLLAVHRVQPHLPAARRPARLRPDRDLRPRGRGPVAGPGDDLLGRRLPLAGAPGDRRARLARTASPTGTGSSGCRTRCLPSESDAVGPRRMVSTTSPTWPRCCRPTSRAPRFGADERPRAAHPVRRRRRRAAARQPRPPGRRPARHDRARPAAPVGRARGQHPAAAAVRGRRRSRPTAAPRDRRVRLREAPVRAGADQCDLATAEALARRLAPLHAVSPARRRARRAPARSRAPPTSWTCWGSATCAATTPATAWRSRPARDRLRVPIGLGDGGGMVHLDIKESAQQGMGPHGLVIGATGSGKSEFLRTLVLGLAMTHSPEQLNMVLVDFKGGATFAGMSEHAARLGGDHQPRQRADPGRPHAGRPVRRDGAPPGAAARRRQLRLGARLRARPGRPASRPRARCRHCSSSSTSSPRCSRPSRSSSTCSSRSAGWAARSVCTSCSPPSGWRRAGCAGWSPTCPTGSDCAPSPPRSRAPCSACRTPTSCRRCPGWASSSPTSRRCCGSRRPTSPGRPRGATARSPRDEGGARAGHPAVDDHRGAAARARRAGAGAEPEPEQRQQPASRSPCSTSPSGRMDGFGPAAHQVWLPPLDVPDTLDELMPDLAADPELGLVSQQWRARRRADGPAGHRRPAARAAPRHPHREPVRGQRPRRRGRRAAHRQEHAAPHAGRQPGADHDPAGVAVLRPRLRRRHVRGAARAAPRGRDRHPVRARRRTPDRGRGDRRRRPSRGLLPRPRHRLDRDLPQPARRRPRRRRLRRRLPGRRRLEHAARRLRRPRDGPAAARLARPDLRLPRGHRRSSRWADFRAAMRDLFGTRLELRLGDPIDSEIDRRAGRAGAARAGPAAAWCRASCTSSAPCPGSTATPDADDPRRRRRGAGRAGRRRPGRARPARSCGCCPSSSPSTTCSAQAGDEPTASKLAAAARRRREGARPGRPRRGRRAAPADLRRRPVRQERRPARPTCTR